MANVSPGVYSKIIDLSTYIQKVPSTIGCLVLLAKKGRDNQFLFIGSRSELIAEFGEPNISDYGKNYGQGLYEAYNFLGESGALYITRCLPDLATYANVRINAVYDVESADSTAAISIDYCSDVNTMNEIQTYLQPTGTSYPICILRPIGRGEYYNGISIKLSEHANPMYNGVYILDVYEKQSDGDEVIIESFEVSFDPKAVDKSGDSIWIGYILEMYSTILRCDMIISGELGDDPVYSQGYEIVAKVYDKEIGSVSLSKAAGTISDTKQDFRDWQALASPATYMIIAKDGRGNKIYGWVGSTGADYDTVNIYTSRDLSEQGWLGNTIYFNDDTAVQSNIITYEVKQSDPVISESFNNAVPVPLKRGSDGPLLNSDGSLNFAEAKQLVSQGYLGTLLNPETGDYEDKILDTENYYFTMVFDAGYPSVIKTQISTLVQTRRDCVAILDNGDNPTYQSAINKRRDEHVFNNFYCALYEPFNKIYDSFTGADIWVSPVYHMSYLLPRNDNVSEIWYAAAGFNRAAIDSIKDLRFNLKLGQRDEFYLKQINDIVKFSSGYVVWSQLTTQAKASALQDLNIVRLVLYCKRSIEQFAKFFIFEMNDAVTWNTFNSQVINFLEEIKKKRGLYSYSVETTATDYEKRTKVFHCDIILEPTRTVEQIHLNFFIK